MSFLRVRYAGTIVTDLPQQLRDIANEEFYYGKKGYCPTGKTLNEAADMLLSQSAEIDGLRTLVDQYAKEAQTALSGQRTCRACGESYAWRLLPMQLRGVK